MDCELGRREAMRRREEGYRVEKKGRKVGERRKLKTKRGRKVEEKKGT